MAGDSQNKRGQKSALGRSKKSNIAVANARGGRGQDPGLTPHTRPSARSKSPKARSRSPFRRGKSTEPGAGRKNKNGQVVGRRKGCSGGDKRKDEGAYQHRKIHPGLALCNLWTVIGHVGMLIAFSNSKSWDIALWLTHWFVFFVAAAFAPTIASAFKSLNAWIWGISHLTMVCGLLFISSLVTFLPMRIIMGLAVFSYQGIFHELLYGCVENRTSRHSAMLASNPFARAGHLFTNVDTIDTDEPCPEIVPELIKALQSSFLSVSILIGIEAALLTFPFGQFGFLYPNGQLHPMAECYIFAAKFYPVLNLVANMVQKVPVLLFTGGSVVLTLPSGKQPLRNHTLRDFWGGNYNKAISDIGRRAIFNPARHNLGLPPIVASLLVFTWTGAMHAVPLALMPTARWHHVLMTFLFFPLNWLFCAMELRWRPSMLRSWLVFLALFPLFGLSWVLVTHPPPVSMLIHVPLR